MMLRETFPVGPFQCNCTVLACEQTKEAVIIDPGGDADRIREIAEHHDLTVKAIIHTHAHLDHIGGTRDVKEAHGGEVCLHKDDLSLYQGFKVQAAMFGLSAGDVAPIDRFIDHGDGIAFGRHEAKVIHTPGHTQGSVCFELVVDGKTIVFAGDTLFRRGIGRTDLPGGNARQLLQSIRTRLYKLDPEALVIPGHGPNTTIVEESRQNPFVTA